MGDWFLIASRCDVEGSDLDWIDMLTYFVDYAIPGVACVVDDDVDLAVTEVCGLLDQGVDVFVVEHVAGDSEGLAAVFVDGVRDVLRLLYHCVSANHVSASTPAKCSRAIWFACVQDTLMNREKLRLTAIDIAHNDFGTFVREESCCFGANALS